MNTISDGEYQTLTWDADDSLLVVRSKPATASASVQAMQSDCLAYARALDELRPIRVLIDTRNDGFEADDAFAEWADEHVFPSDARVIRRKAYVFAAHFVEEHGIDDSTTSEVELPFATRIFIEEQRALAWLVEL